MMPQSKYSTANSILFALNILPALVNGYDCASLKNNGCTEGDSSSLSFYSNCMVQQYSFSAFIQCASQSNVPDFTAKDSDGGANNISPIDVLTRSLTLAGANSIVAPACDHCPLAHNILKAANEHGTQNFAKYLCSQYNPQDSGLCCLRDCLLSKPREHSIQALCSGKNVDLMNAPTLPESCGGDVSGGSSGAASGNSGDGDTSGAAPSSDDSSSPKQTTSSSTTPTPSSTTSTTSPTTNSATPTSSTSTSSTPQATPSTKTGAASRRQLTYSGLALLPILAIF